MLWCVYSSQTRYDPSSLSINCLRIWCLLWINHSIIRTSILYPIWLFSISHIFPLRMLNPYLYSWKQKHLSSLNHSFKMRVIYYWSKYVLIVYCSFYQHIYTILSITNYSNTIYKDEEHAYSILYHLLCSVKSILNTHIGIETIAHEDSKSLLCLLQLFNIHNSPLIILLLDILSVLCIYSEDSYKQIVYIINKYSVIMKEIIPYESITNLLQSCSDLQLLIKTLTFINLFVNTSTDINERCCVCIDFFDHDI